MSSAVFELTGVFPAQRREQKNASADLNAPFSQDLFFLTAATIEGKCDQNKKTYTGKKIFKKAS